MGTVTEIVGATTHKVRDTFRPLRPFCRRRSKGVLNNQRVVVFKGPVLRGITFVDCSRLLSHGHDPFIQKKKKKTSKTFSSFFTVNRSLSTRTTVCVLKTCTTPAH